jgi:hypothetical protein
MAVSRKCAEDQGLAAPAQDAVDSSRGCVDSLGEAVIFSYL